MLERFLVPLDSSKVAEQVLPYVAWLAKQLGQPVVLLSVVADGAALNPIASAHDAEIASLLEKRREFAQHYLADIKTRLDGQGVSTSAEVATGPVADSIVAVAAAQKAGLIALATHGRVGPERWFLGSVADKVVRTASVPVLLIRPHEGTAQRTASVQQILLPLDGSTLAEAAIAVATSLAKTLAVPVTVVRTLDLTQLTASADPYTGIDGISQELLDLMEADAKQYLEKIAAHLQKDGIKVKTEFSFLPPATEITDLAEKEAGTLIVMSTNGRSGLVRTLLGSVTDRVIRSSVAPVLVIPGNE